MLKFANVTDDDGALHSAVSSVYEGNASPLNLTARDLKAYLNRIFTEQGADSTSLPKGLSAMSKRNLAVPG